MAAFGWMGIAALQFALLLLRMVWSVVKLLVCLGVLYGVWLDLKPLPLLTPAMSLSLNEWLTDAKALILYAADNWIPVALGVIFCVVLQTRQYVKRAYAQADDRLLKIMLGTVTLMSYLDIAVETDGMVQIRERGWWSSMKKSWTEQLLFRLVGIDPISDALTARAVRSSMRVSLAQDIEAQLGELRSQLR